MNSLTFTFFELLQISVGTRNMLTESPSRKEWEELWKIAKKQALFGILFESICKLPESQRPPKNLILRSVAQSEMVVQQNVFLDQKVIELHDILEELNIPYCILKGQGVASLYSERKYRQPGDIDVWCDCENRNTLLKKIGVKYKVKDTMIHHTHVSFFDNLKVDLHYIPTWLYAPWNNKRLIHYFMLEKGKQMNNIKINGFNIPTIEFNLVYSLMHLFGHFMGKGIGLRQFMDYYYIIIHSSENDREKAVEVLKSIGKIRFLSSVMYVLQQVFLLQEKYFLVEPNEKMGKILLQEIVIGGNFGYYDERYHELTLGTRWGRFKRRILRMYSLFSFAPDEVICAPFWIIWHYCWRKKNGYI